MAATAVPKRAVRLAELLAHRAQINGIATRYGIHNVRVFGSVARDTATADSDLDLLVDVQPGHGYSRTRRCRSTSADALRRRSPRRGTV